MVVAVVWPHFFDVCRITGLSHPEHIAHKRNTHETQTHNEDLIETVRTAPSAWKSDTN